ncbi:signal recognition particle-docking protein FtsY [Alkalispirillum mobile]|uniref:Signal recognition particle receptor FtsY n=1 Tax=Alkalispirillum mobile TaxID=85925 RepID=A0A498BT27_9GAMM|nr:signal recognition particle-docking protein FtsY [Alkalispirillum mobile]RLK47124.1 signal recognition particle-docking protein FtsY [Alkalispirillum mobile]
MWGFGRKKKQREKAEEEARRAAEEAARTQAESADQAADEPEPEATPPADEPAPAPAAEAPAAPEPAPAPTPAASATADKPRKKQGLFARLRAGLSRTRSGLTEGIASLFLGSKTIDDDLLEELETQLLMADVGVEATQRIIDGLTARLRRAELKDTDALFQALKEDMTAILAPCEAPLVLPDEPKPFVILMVGINGAGKTTTIGKLARRYGDEGRRVMLAAGDTFRAAAVEQLQAWGERNNTPVIAQHTGADAASVVFDGWQAAKARGSDLLIADTAGRLHTQGNLMEELRKIKRVLGKQDNTAPHETLLVLDAGNGQNALAQAREFHQAIGLDGLVITKLDGTARGGVIFAIAEQLKLPIRYIGVGESAEDLRPFVAADFVEALLQRDDQGRAEG